MINTKDQEDLFRLITDYLQKDITCMAIGGTAMMFSGYKAATKDIDLALREKKLISENVKEQNEALHEKLQACLIGEIDDFYLRQLIFQEFNDLVPVRKEHRNELRPEIFTLHANEFVEPVVPNDFPLFFLSGFINYFFS